MTSPTLSDKIRTRRAAAGLSQLDAACRVGVSQATWSKWEIGTHTPRSSRLGDIADALGCAACDLT